MKLHQPFVANGIPVRSRNIQVGNINPIGAMASPTNRTAQCNSFELSMPKSCPKARSPITSNMYKLNSSDTFVE